MVTVLDGRNWYMCWPIRCRGVLLLLRNDFRFLVPSFQLNIWVQHGRNGIVSVKGNSAYSTVLYIWTVKNELNLASEYINSERLQLIESKRNSNIFERVSFGFWVPETRKRNANYTWTFIHVALNIPVRVNNSGHRPSQYVLQTNAQFSACQTASLQSLCQFTYC